MPGTWAVCQTLTVLYVFGEGEGKEIITCRKYFGVMSAIRKSLGEEGRIQDLELAKSLVPAWRFRSTGLCALTGFISPGSTRLPDSI